MTNEILYVAQVQEVVRTAVATELLERREQGPPGPPGSPGLALKYTHVQSTLASTWVVNHNLGAKPIVSVLSVGGLQMLAEVIHISANQLQVIFDTPVAGSVICS